MKIYLPNYLFQVCGRKIRVNRSVRKPKTNLLTQGAANKRPIKFDESKVSFSKKFADKKNKLMTRTKTEGKPKKKKEEGKAFQGVTTGTTAKKEKLSKGALKKMYIAKALMN